MRILIGLAMMIGALYWLNASVPQCLLFAGYILWTVGDAQVSNVRRIGG